MLSVGVSAFAKSTNVSSKPKSENWFFHFRMILRSDKTSLAGIKIELSDGRGGKVLVSEVMDFVVYVPKE